jgi:ABC-2 type transport system ATP-binding protein
MPLFEAINIEKSYTGHKALDKVSIHVPEGSVYGLLGPNGAGKTTLIRIINRITAPDSGELLFNGRKYTREDLAFIGYLPEERGLYKKMKVGEQALYLARLKGLDKKEAMLKLKKWFAKFGMTDWWDKKVEELSKGMAQKVQFIVTVLHEPKLLIFDEPFSGFDPVNANMLKNEVLDLKKKGTTIIFSTHDMSSVEELCDHITLINRSKTVLEGRVHEIRERFKSNIYNLEFDGNPDNLRESLNGNFEIIDLNPLPFQGFSVTVKMNGAKDSNDLLRSVINSISIKKFSEVLPTMNEIFIKVVSENQNPAFHE